MKKIKICTWEHCASIAKAKGFCYSHYKLACKNGTVTEFTVCSVEGCSSPLESLGLCALHYQKTEKRKEYHRKWYNKNIEAVKVAAKKYRESPGAKKLNKEYWKSPKIRYSGAVKRAKADNKEFSISFEEYTDLISKKCSYCNGELPSKGTGLDRVDNTKGYTLSNVVPACTFCNKARNDLFTREEFMEIVVLVKRLRSKENIWEGYWWGNRVITANGKRKDK